MLFLFFSNLLLAIHLFLARRQLTIYIVHFSLDVNTKLRFIHRNSKYEEEKPY